MNQKLLNEAGSQLQFVAVFLRKGHVFFHEDIESPEFSDKFKVQSFKGVRSYTVKELEAESSNHFLYDFEYSVGLRAADLGVDEDQDDFLKAEIIATYSVRYKSDDEVRRECIEEFLKNNVGYHVWPFWREHVQSSCMKAGVGLLPVPLYTDFQKQISTESDD
ncbi:hypothetical protein [Endozoicomonas sp. SCSIO W0465]|uniref:hypothetical protein n=1 Tax=Endozoicomonas sp. SCSIO W0465 TaxID=2918516 RepID=UPI002075ED44|nr:hypothetical protein [Endozoicomonas sp. SCSIO W0465]USE34102.1 hypothetical protein MJO57_18235 [Endozoicomonas sp. SCSIO W0465]